jgi:hypothetical protein
MRVILFPLLAAVLIVIAMTMLARPPDSPGERAPTASRMLR